MAETLNLLEPFDFANVGVYNPGAGFAEAEFVFTEDAEQLIIANLPETVVGGSRIGNTHLKQWLLIRLIATKEIVRGRISSIIEADLYWIGHHEEQARKAELNRMNDTERSLGVAYYHRDQKQHQKLRYHQILGWTLRCAIHLVEHRWTSDYDVDHRDQKHQNNRIENLYPWKKKGEDGHRAASGRLGGNATAARKRRFEALSAASLSARGKTVHKRPARAAG